MSDIALKNAFFRNAYGITFADSSGLSWAFDASTNRLSASPIVGTGTVTDKAITNAKLDDMPQATVKGRPSGVGTGVPSDLTASQVKAILALASADLSDFTEAAQDAVGALIASSATIAPTYNDAGNALTLSIIDGTVTYAKIQNVSATSRVLGRITAGAGVTEELTGANLATIIGGNLAANPSASAGLTAVNGSASTYMRSDGAPAISVSITPTWSALHTFTGGVKTSTAGVGDPLVVGNSSAAASTKYYCIHVGANFVQFTTATDAGVAANTAFEFDRSGVNVTALFFGNGSDNPTSTFLGTGLVQLNGDLKVVGKSGFNNTTAISKPTVTGSKGANAALASLLTALASYGLITDSST